MSRFFQHKNEQNILILIVQIEIIYECGLILYSDIINYCFVWKEKLYNKFSIIYKTTALPYMENFYTVYICSNTIPLLFCYKTSSS